MPRVNRYLRFRLPADAPECVAFAYSPLLETVLSLHVLVDPKHHALQHDWVRRGRRLPAALRQRIRAFAFAYHSLIPDVLFPSGQGELAPLEEEVASLRRLDGETAALEFLRPLWDHEGRRDPALLRDARVRNHVARRSAHLGSDPRLAALIFDDPLSIPPRSSPRTPGRACRTRSSSGC